MAESGALRLGTLAAVAVAWLAPVTLVRTDAVFLLVAAALAWQWRAGSRAVDLPLIAAAAAVTASHVLSAWAASGQVRLPPIVAPLLVLVAVAHLKTGPAVETAVAASAATWSAVGLAAWGLFHLDLIPVSHLATPNSANLPGAARVSGVLSSNSLPLYLGLSIPWIVHGRWGRRRARLLALALTLAAAAGAQSRGLVSVFVALSAPVRDATAFWQAVRRASRVLALAGLVALGPVTWWAIAPRDEGGWEPRVNAYALLHAASLRLWQQSPWVGWGPGSFPHAYARVTTAEERGATFPPLKAAGMGPHSPALAALAETGLVGFAAWAALSAVVLRRLGAAPPGSVPHAVRYAVAGLLVATLHMDFELLRSLWALIGLGLAAARHGEPC
jgi:O-antigen ligase